MSSALPLCDLLLLLESSNAYQADSRRTQCPHRPSNSGTLEHYCLGTNLRPKFLEPCLTSAGLWGCAYPMLLSQGLTRLC